SFEEKDEMTGRRFAVSMFPVTLPHGETDLVAEYALDITERKQHEEFKEEVGRIIRHDLKAPLASMISGIHMLSSDDLEPDTRKRLLETLDQTAAITIRTADSSLDIFKMKEGIFVVPDETFSVFDMINHLKQQFRYFLEYKNVRLDLMYENILEQKGPDDFQGKRHNIEALLANLIQNAYEAAPNESVVSLVIKKRDKAILFEVHNESEIYPEARKNLFKQYATYGKSGGTGLGLYSALLTAKAYGGDIEAKSSSSEGTTFTAILPWTQESTS
ncbi:MAG: HAMP domain-containing histidine kinase, partial [Desulfobulbaceae bacterium]|nr:HAMP domain-containing histidine kinase [Desulfobulbaceae bacterium]